MGSAATARAQQPDTSLPRPSFKTSVDLVTVFAVVRDARGRLIRNLTQADFEVLDGGKARHIVDFRPDEQGPISIGLLFDVSGSMSMGRRLASARHAADHVLAWLNPGVDEAGLFTFDTSLREVQAFTSNPMTLHKALDAIEPYGATSLFDAIAGAAEQLGTRQNKRRALLVLTDGRDTASRLAATQVSGIASSIDVPVYLIAVSTANEHPGEDIEYDPEQDTIDKNLRNLAYWTGGDLYIVVTPAQASTAARRLLDELRQQYVIAFEAATEPGWRPVEIRTRGKNFQVRARSGYLAGNAHVVRE